MLVLTAWNTRTGPAQVAYWVAMVRAGKTKLFVAENGPSWATFLTQKSAPKKFMWVPFLRILSWETRHINQQQNKGAGRREALGYCPKILLPKRAKMVLCSFHRSHKEICTRNRRVSETKYLGDFLGGGGPFSPGPFILQLNNFFSWPKMGCFVGRHVPGHPLNREKKQKDIWKNKLWISRFLLFCNQHGFARCRSHQCSVRVPQIH